MRTSVATGAPGRQVLADARPGARLTAPSIGASDHGVGELLAGQLELRAPLGQHGLAVAHLLERVLVAALGHLKGGLGGVELRPGR